MDENDKQEGVEGSSKEYVAKDEVQANETKATLEPAMIEETIVEAEIEPGTSTGFFEQEPSTISDRPARSTPEATVVETVDPTATPTTPVVGLSATKKSDKKRLILMIVAGVVLFALVSVVAWRLIGGKKDTTTDNRAEDTSSTPIEQPKLGVAVTVADGIVEYMRKESNWQPVDTTTQLQEKDSVRTGAESRAVLTLDDGSAVRLDTETTVEISSLAADDVEIKQTGGTVYSRVVPSDRMYTVAVDETNYEALGTAFMTTNKLGESGVQVYQSAVKTSATTEPIGEGSQYYTINSDAELMGKVTTIDMSSLVDNDFINWNAAEDEKDTTFKDKLGVLPQIEEIAKQQAKKEAAEAAEKAKQEEEARTSSNKTMREEMVLSYKNNKLSWAYTGKAVNGYKLIYSTSNKEPTFNANDTKSIYYSNINETSGKLPGKGTYHVSVCAYTATGTCINYSNTVHISIN